MAKRIVKTKPVLTLNGIAAQYKVDVSESGSVRIPVGKTIVITIQKGPDVKSGQLIHHSYIVGYIDMSHNVPLNVPTGSVDAREATFENIEAAVYEAIGEAERRTIEKLEAAAQANEAKPKNKSRSNTMATKKKAAPKAPVAFTKSQLGKVVHRDSVFDYLTEKGVDNDIIVELLDESFGDEDTIKFSALLKAYVAAIDCVSGDESTHALFAAAIVEPANDDDADDDDADADDADADDADADDDADEDVPPPSNKKGKKSNVPPPTGPAGVKKGFGEKTWGPGFIRPAEKDDACAKVNKTSKLADIMRLIKKGKASIESIATSVSASEADVKRLLRAESRKSGVGFSINAKNVLTLIGDVEYVTPDANDADHMAKLRAMKVAKQEAARKEAEAAAAAAARAAASKSGKKQRR